jgi:putative aldouronate transport system permease protein
MYGIQLAFKDFYIKKGIWGSPWVGLDKFRMLMRTVEFWGAFKNTLLISFLKTAIGFPIPIILSIMINEIKSSKLKRTMQTVYTFPHFLSWVILSGIMMNLFGNDGSVNNLIALLGRERAGFLINPGIFRGMLIFTEIWKESGWSCIMYLAAIAAINPELYEGATIDGANRWHKAVYITWPGIRDMAAILLILSIGNAMNANFDQVFNMYNPAVFSSADIIDTYVYRITFQLQADYGFSTAVGLFKGVINFTLLIAANAVVKRLGQSTIV